MTQEPAAASGRSWIPIRTVALCFLVALLEGYDIQSFGVAAPRLVVEFALSPSTLGLVGGVAMIGLMFGAWLGGAMAERFSTKLVLIGATIAFGACSLLTATASSLTELLLFRLLTGLGFGGVMPNLLSIATRLRPAGNHAGVATLIFCGMPVGGALLAALATSLGSPLPWRTLFAVGGLLPLLLVPALIFALPSFAAVPLENSEGLYSALFGDGRALRTLALWIAFGLALLLLYLLLNWLPLLVIAKGWHENIGAAAAMGFNLGGIAGALALGQWADRRGYRAPLSASALIMVLGLCAMLVGSDLLSLLAAAVLMGGGVVGLQYLLYAAAPTPYPTARSIAAAGAAIGVGRLGSIAGPILAGVGRQAGLSPGVLLATLIPVAVVIAVSGVFALSQPYRAIEPLRFSGGPNAA